MNAEELYVSLQRCIEELPDLKVDPVPESSKRWLARAFALIDITKDIADTLRARQLTSNLTMYPFDSMPEELLAILYRRLAVAELQAPAAIRGAFINAGNVHDAMVVVGTVLQSATVSARIVDPYMDNKALEDFALLANPGVAIELLADAHHVKPTLNPSAVRFAAQYGATRPLAVRLAPARTLHDRLIIVDGQTVWTLTQSLNAFAARAPASIVRVDGDAVPLKIAAYDDFWNNGQVMI